VVLLFVFLLIVFCFLLLFFFFCIVYFRFLFFLKLQKKVSLSKQTWLQQINHLPSRSSAADRAAAKTLFRCHKTPQNDSSSVSSFPSSLPFSFSLLYFPLNKEFFRTSALSYSTLTNVNHTFFKSYPFYYKHLGREGSDIIRESLSREHPREVITKFQKENSLSEENDKFLSILSVIIIMILWSELLVMFSFYFFGWHMCMCMCVLFCFSPSFYLYVLFYGLFFLWTSRGVSVVAQQLLTLHGISKAWIHKSILATLSKALLEKVENMDNEER